jgi:transposase
MVSKTQKKRYDQEFKKSAVKLVENGKSAALVARELGLPEWQVQNWVRAIKNQSSAGTSDENIRLENQRLKKENARLQEEADILKKAAAFFARNQQ